MNGYVQDNFATCEGSVKYNGDGKPDAVGIFFRNNNLISNAVNVSFGDGYGTGCNARFYNNQLTKIGNYANYHTINMLHPADDDVSVGSQFFDTVLNGGASLLDVVWPTSGSPNFSVGWSLRITTTPGATVKVYDTASPSVPIFTGTADANGNVYVENANGDPILLQFLLTQTGQTSSSYNVDSFYGGTHHWRYGVIVDGLGETIAL